MRLPLPLLGLAAGLLLSGCDLSIFVNAPEPEPEKASERAAVVLAAAPARTAVAEAPAATPPRTPAPAPGALAPGDRGTGGNGPRRRVVEPNPPFKSTAVATLNEPWAMTFLPDGRLLVTEKNGQLRLVNPANGQVGTVTGVPNVGYGGQGGLGDVILHPQYASNRRIYLSYVERSGAIYGAVVIRARLNTDSGGGGNLTEITRIWEQLPKVSGQGHFSHRLAFDGSRKLWITSGDRQKLDPAQDMSTHLGKIVRVNDDGSTPSDNPFVGQGEIQEEIWSLGHRNPLGIAFDAQGRVWAHEMGPAGGDELNLILKGRNYGWPLVSEGNHYDGTAIPRHSTRPEFEAPKAHWTPVIAPAGFIIYSGSLFPTFVGDGFIGGLASQALVRIRFNGTSARELARYPMGRRIREVEQGPDGAIWVLEDGANGRLLKLTPP